MAVTGTDSSNQNQTEKIGLLEMSVANGLTADAGSVQAGATPIEKGISRFTVVATAGDSALLPQAKAGRMRIVCNADASDSMDIFPAAGDAINAIAADGAYALAANKAVLFFCAVDGTWTTILTA